MSCQLSLLLADFFVGWTLSADFVVISASCHPNFSLAYICVSWISWLLNSLVCWNCYCLSFLSAKFLVSWVQLNFLLAQRLVCWVQQSFLSAEFPVSWITCQLDSLYQLSFLSAQFFVGWFVLSAELLVSWIACQLKFLSAEFRWMACWIFCQLIFMPAWFLVSGNSCQRSL